MNTTTVASVAAFVTNMLSPRVMVERAFGLEEFQADVKSDSCLSFMLLMSA